MSEAHLSDDGLVAFVDGTLSEHERRRWLAHVDQCSPCHELLAAAAPALGSDGSRDDSADTTVLRGARVGRFTVLDLLGVGATAEVHTAYDPQLDRKVALKLLRSEDTVGGGDKRLLREAQALARLAHPNVVSVFDAGEHGDRRFVAMELVEGETLRTWLAAAERPWIEILRMFIAAGRGLAAAHAVGIVHRDFKPDNVLVGADGRPRVADFGLARAAGEPSQRPVRGAPVDDTHAATITQTGSAVGTPAYMAPEQLVGDDATATSDQFAFCVSLWEGLTGTRPFSTTTALTRLERIERGEPGAFESSAPASVRRALERGLAAFPGDRWPTIDALLAALEAALPRRRRAAIAAGVLGVVAVAAIGVAGVALSRDDEGARCELAPPSGLWDADMQHRVRAAFLATQRPYAADTYARVDRALAELVAQLATQRRAACEAGARGEQSSALLDLQMACLDRRVAETRALTGVLAGEPDVDTLDGAVDAVAKLPPIERCDRAALADAYPAPDIAVGPAVASLRQQLAAATALVAVGRYDAAIAETEPLVAAADHLAYPPLSAEVRLARAEALLQAAKPAAKDALYDAALAAARARDRRGEIQALLWIVPALGDDRGKLDDALEAARHVEIALAAAGDGPELADLRETLALARAQVFRDQARYADARALVETTLAARRKRGLADDAATGRTLFQLATLLGDMGQAEAAPPVFEQALVIFESRLGPEHPNVAAVLNNLGMALERIGRYDDARATYERALGLKIRTLGPEHPGVATTLNNLAMVADDQGRLDDAAMLQERALAIREAKLGPEHPMIASSLSNLAATRTKQGRYTEAIALHRRALAMREKLTGAKHPGVAQSLSGLASALRMTGELDEARTAIARAIAIREEVQGKDHEDLAPALATQGYILLSLHRSDACASFDRAIAILEHAHGAGHPDLATYLDGAAECAIAANRIADATKLAERAIAIASQPGANPVRAAHARFVLADARWRIAPADRARAVAEIAALRDQLVAMHAADDDLREIDAWLRTHTR
ncbi:MAG TPA: serine/threonine-protein kinase [Kofleriaceae bacterium]|nr:serine/threonine-protein kinase [Kofleriaceae bacterium]